MMIVALTFGTLMAGTVSSAFADDTVVPSEPAPTVLDANPNLATQSGPLTVQHVKPDGSLSSPATVADACGNGDDRFLAEDITTRDVVLGRQCEGVGALDVYVSSDGGNVWQAPVVLPAQGGQPAVTAANNILYLLASVPGPNSQSLALSAFDLRTGTLLFRDTTLNGASWQGAADELLYDTATRDLILKYSDTGGGGHILVRTPDGTYVPASLPQPLDGFSAGSSTLTYTGDWQPALVRTYGNCGADVWSGMTQPMQWGVSQFRRGGFVNQVSAGGTQAPYFCGTGQAGPGPAGTPTVAIVRSTWVDSTHGIGISCPGFITSLGYCGQGNAGSMPTDAYVAALANLDTGQTTYAPVPYVQMPLTQAPSMTTELLQPTVIGGADLSILARTTAVTTTSTGGTVTSTDVRGMTWSTVDQALPTGELNAALTSPDPAQPRYTITVQPGAGVLADKTMWRVLNDGCTGGLLTCPQDDFSVNSPTGSRYTIPLPVDNTATVQAAIVDGYGQTRLLSLDIIVPANGGMSGGATNPAGSTTGTAGNGTGTSGGSSSDSAGPMPSGSGSSGSPDASSQPAASRPTGYPAAPPARAAALKIRPWALEGHEVTLRATLWTGRGRLAVSASHGSRTVALRVRRQGNTYVVKGRLPAAGKWQIRVRFLPAKGWRSQTITRTVTVQQGPAAADSHVAVCRAVTSHHQGVDRAPVKAEDRRSGEPAVDCRSRSFVRTNGG